MKYNYRIELTPLEDYFFGNDKTFKYGQDNPSVGGDYFIKSERFPNQSTLFGLLRYLLLDKNKVDFTLNEEEIRRIGKESFNYSENQDFGIIKKISPLYFYDDNDYFIKVPSNHYDDQQKYQAIKEYENNLPLNFYAKNYRTDYLMAITNNKNELGSLIKFDDVFAYNVKIGINRNNEVDGLFKKEYCNLKGFKFVYFAELIEEFNFSDQIVFLGQGKSAFKAKITRVADFLDLSPLKALINKDEYLAVSDLFIDHDLLDQLNHLTSFKITNYKEVRGFKTNYGNRTNLERYSKSKQLYCLISAGSIFKVLENKSIEINNCANVIGLNVLIKGER